MAVMHRSRREALTARGEADHRKAEAQKKAEAETARRADAKLMSEVESHLRAKLKTVQEDAALTDAERLEKRLRQLEQSPADTPARAPERPTGWGLCEEEILRRWRREADEEREKVERKDGTLARREAWDGRRQAIVDKRNADLRNEDERHQAARQRISEHFEDAQLKLGDRP
jgi:hypothetical protein